MTRARDIANFGDGIATADIGDGQVTAGKLNSTLDLTGKTVTLPAGVGGKVLQVVQFTSSTQTAFTNTSFADTQFTASITPAATSSKILVNWTSSVTVLGDSYFWIQLFRGPDSVIYSPFNSAANFGSDNQHGHGYSFQYLDSPSTTSSTLYKVQMKKGGASTIYIPGESGDAGSFTLIEIAG